MFPPESKPPLHTGDRKTLYSLPRMIRILPSLPLAVASGQTCQHFFSPELWKASPATIVTSKKALSAFSLESPPLLSGGGGAGRQGGRRSWAGSESSLKLQQLKWPFSLGLGFHLHRAPEKRCAFRRIRADNSVLSENKIKPERNWRAGVPGDCANRLNLCPPSTRASLTLSPSVSRSPASRVPAAAQLQSSLMVC